MSLTTTHAFFARLECGDVEQVTLRKVFIMNNIKNNRSTKRYFVGVGLGLILVFVIYVLLGRFPFDNTHQNAGQQSSMPAVSNSYEPSLDDIRFVELQFSAVITDMYMYLGWFPEEKEMLKKASVKAISDLKTIKDYLRQLNFTGDLIELKDMHLAIIDMLVQIYDGIELKSTDDIKRAFAEFNGLYYSEKYEEALKQYKSLEKLPEDYDLKEPECAYNQQDKETYLNAIEFVKEKRFDQAYKDLVRLREKYKDTAFEHCIMLKMSYCLIMAEPNERGDSEFNSEKKGIALLSDILDAGEYSPVLFDAFYKWRTMTQLFWHGMSNMSEIPNWEYNEKRWSVIQTVKQHIKDNPDDVWAKTQMNLLLSLPNIKRGGPFGNYNIDHWVMLYQEYSKP